MKQNRPKVIVITGGIGTGKTTAVNIIKELGFTVLDSDKIVHEGYNIGSELYDKIINYFGEEILKENKAIDRQKLGKIVFNNEEKLNKLNSIVHVYVYYKLKEGIEESSDSVIFLDIPLMLETKGTHEPTYDEIWLIYVSEETQRKRLTDRAISENKNPEDVLKIIDKQIPIEEKVLMADEVINNEGSRNELMEKIKNLLEIKGIGW
jgi:dephospho-CoA kinase